MIIGVLTSKQEYVKSDDKLKISNTNKKGHKGKVFL